MIFLPIIVFFSLVGAIYFIMKGNNFMDSKILFAYFVIAFIILLIGLIGRYLQ